MQEIYRNYAHYPCGKTAKFQENGKWWCGTHAPSKVAAKRAVREAKWADDSKIREKQHAITEAASRVVVAALAWNGVNHTGLTKAINHLREVSK
jgi:hypothetical protein